jgi:hypothetical protein
VPAALAAPALIPVANAYLVPYWRGLWPTGFIQHVWPTGFIQHDMPYYMANGRQYFDQGFQLTYGNPYAPHGTPAIYSQPHVLLLGVLQRLGLDPGLAFNLFGLAAIIFTVLVAIRFYRTLVGLDTTARKLGLVCFIWGGGTFILLGLAYSLAATGHLTWDSVMQFDPVYGWWMLNFGRNLVYPTEAYYHGIFLLSILCLIQRRFIASLALAALLSWSHPFSGLSLVLVLFIFSTLEWVLRSGTVKAVMPIGSAAILACHLGYYMVFLNQFPSHRALREQWSLAWLYAPNAFMPALLLVGMLATIRLMAPPGLRRVLSKPEIRLLLVWFCVVFGLSQHNLVMEPFQPIHFAHGYDWTALFFLGVPVLVGLFDHLLTIRTTVFRLAAVVCVLAILLLDNVVWFTGFFVRSPIPNRIALSMDQKTLLDWLARNSAPEDTVVCADATVSYLVSTYTWARSWYGHDYNTPDYWQRRREAHEVFSKMHFMPEWAPMAASPARSTIRAIEASGIATPTPKISVHNNVLYIADRAEDWRPPGDETMLYQNNEFTVWGRNASIRQQAQ